MTTEEYWAKQAIEAREESEVRMPPGIQKRMRFAKVVIEDSDGNTQRVPYLELRERIGGTITIGRRFIMDDAVWKIIRKDIPSNRMPVTTGNYKHTRFEYTNAKTKGGKI